METKLYVILGSHACRTSMLMLEHKGIDYRRVELPPILHPFSLPLYGFSRNSKPLRKVGDKPPRMLRTADRMGTVPALVMDGRRVKTNLEISRFLDTVQPEPPLFPADPDRRRAVEEAEGWGDEVLQMAARRLVLTASLPGGVGLNRDANDGRLGPLLWKHRTVRLAGTRFIALLVFRANSRAEPGLVAEVPALLDHVDELIESGVLNGDELNAADFMIAPSLALLSYRPDVGEEIERRRAIELLDRLLPDPAAAPAQPLAA
jgi:glutathione S-transferase